MIGKYHQYIYNINRQSSKWGKSVAMAGVSLLSLGQRRESLDRYVREDRFLITKANKEQDSQVVKIVYVGSNIILQYLIF